MDAVNVVKAFTLTFIREGRMVKQRVEVGIQQLERDVAEHWYTKAHCADMPEAKVEAVADVKPVSTKAGKGK